MVYQMPCPGHVHLFVASSIEDNAQAREEVQNWAHRHGYDFARTAATFTVYQGENLPREWVLLERAAKKSKISAGN